MSLVSPIDLGIKIDLPLALQVLEETGRFSSGVLARLNGSVDRQSCRWLDGDVSTPTGFADAYRALSRAAGQHCPAALSMAEGAAAAARSGAAEMLHASNHA